jgi:hypothetical protein
MAIYAQLSDLDDVKQLIDNSGFLETGETVTVSEDVLTITDANSNTLFEWTDSSTRKAYADSTNYNTFRTSNSYTIVDGIGCSNGVIIRLRYGSDTSGTKDAPIRMVRTNLGKIAFVFWASASHNADPTDKVAFYSEQCCVCWGDITPLRSVTFGTYDRMQTEVVPMFTNAQMDRLSKTMKSGFLVYNHDRSVNFRYLLINGHRFITDGFFAIEDEEVNA